MTVFLLLVSYLLVALVAFQLARMSMGVIQVRTPSNEQRIKNAQTDLELARLTLEKRQLELEIAMMDMKHIAVGSDLT